jgi:hypothetical protein
LKKTKKRKWKVSDFPKEQVEARVLVGKENGGVRRQVMQPRQFPSSGPVGPHVELRYNCGGEGTFQRAAIRRPAHTINHHGHPSALSASGASVDD